jgi:hypothetical protein
VLRQLFADKSVTRTPIECDRLVLDFGGAELKPYDPAAATFSLRVLQHSAADGDPACGGIDIHATQFHSIIRCTLQAEGANQSATQGRHSKPDAMLAIVVLNPVNLVGQRAFDIGFESVAQIGWAEQPVYCNDEFAHARTVRVGETGGFRAYRCSTL